MIIIRLIVVLVALSICKEAFCGGFSTWSTKTPSNNSLWFEHYGYPKWTIYCEKFNSGNNLHIDNIEEFYFYNGAIIGKLRDKNFFVFYENDCSSLFFYNKQALENYLEDNDLEPTFWTRWYSKDWQLIVPSDEFGSSLAFLFFKLPLLIFLVVLTLVCLVWVEMKSARLAQIIFFSIWFLIIVRIFLDIFPKSF